MSRRTISDLLAEILDRRRDREADLRPRMVVGRETDGAERQLALDGTCPERCVGANSLGQVVLMPATAPDHRGGLGGGTLSYGGMDLMWVEAQDPPELRRGMSQEVTISGQGLVAGIEFVYHRAAETADPSGIEPHPGVSVDAAEVIDDETYQLTVTVAPDAPLVSGAPIVWTHRNRPRRRDEFYGVVPGELAYAVYLGREQVTLALYDPEGAWAGDVGSYPAAPRADVRPIFGAAGVADLAIAWVDAGGTSVRVWDWVAETLYQLELEAGWQAVGVSWVGGSLWWIEYALPPAAVATIATRLRRAPAQLTSALTVGSHQVVVPSEPGQPVDWQGPAYPAPVLATDGYAALALDWVLGGEVAGTEVVRFALAGGAADQPALDLWGTSFRVAAAAAGRGLVPGAGGILAWDGSEVLAPYLPAAWQDYLATLYDEGLLWDGDADGVGLSRDLATAYVVNAALGVVVVGPVNPGSQPRPDEVLELDPHPTLGGEYLPLQVWPL